jgi:diguanylate cyclase (GGDEF)-like protein
VLPVLTVVLICVPTAVDDRPGPFGPLLLTWPGVFAAAVLSERAAWATLAAAGGSFAMLAAFSRGVDGVIMFAEVMTVISVICAVTISLRRQSQRLRAELAALARTDALTGLPNRRAFDEVMEREFAGYQRHGRPLTLLALDIDHFKQVNDLWGHAVGDQVLSLLGGLLADLVRGTDTVGRIGGEEFAVLVPDCAAAPGLARAQELCQTIREISADWEYPITVSIGVATMPDDAVVPSGLHQAADAALYGAKAAGRDRAEVATHHKSHATAQPGTAVRAAVRRPAAC